MGSFNNPNHTELNRLLMDQKTLGESFSLDPARSAFLSGREAVASISGGVVQSTIGAGGSATTFTTTTNTGNNLTEFTKRKNWSQRIIEELKDFLHVISPTGKLMYCSPSSQELVGYSPEELVGRSIKDFIHVDDVDMFVRDFNMAINQKSSFTLYYRFRKKDDKFIILEVNGHPYFGDNNPTINSTCRCFFSMGRVYPSKTTAMLDSFLELKVENENLRRQLRDLMGPPEPQSVEASTSTAATIGSGMVERTVDVTNETSNPLELLTGLRYQEGERARGISTGSSDPCLLNENLMDVDITSTTNATTSIPVAMTATTTITTSSTSLRDDKSIVVGGGVGISGTAEPRPSGNEPASQASTSAPTPKQRRKPKKPKVEEEEYVCTDCGTVESPEWRKGPLGPKTLCNACGLRWAKKAKRQASGTTIGGGNNGNGGVGGPDLPSSGMDMPGAGD
ncbi:6227_t:CDS:2 [Ambispora leptoticha]|uniref:6227_t:CDS:1 n=1 Tax=Ambispora leptoticha TaxID=144679 RepID=A0A9N8WFG9_9GLOM|nr:6227_t:CDS:2 [Ambispora leptoticha]